MARVRVQDGDVTDLFRPGGTVERIQYGDINRDDLLTRLNRGVDFADKVVKSPAAGILGYGVARGIGALMNQGSSKSDQEALRRAAAEKLMADTHSRAPMDIPHTGRTAYQAPNSLDMSDQYIRNMRDARDPMAAPAQINEPAAPAYDGIAEAAANRLQESQTQAPVQQMPVAPQAPASQYGNPFSGMHPAATGLSTPVSMGRTPLGGLTTQVPQNRPAPFTPDYGRVAPTNPLGAPLSNIKLPEIDLHRPHIADEDLKRYMELKKMQSSARTPNEQMNIQRELQNLHDKISGKEHAQSPVRAEAPNPAALERLNAGPQTAEDRWFREWESDARALEEELRFASPERVPAIRARIQQIRDLIQRTKDGMEKRTPEPETPPPPPGGPRDMSPPQEAPVNPRKQLLEAGIDRLYNLKRAMSPKEKAGLDAMSQELNAIYQREGAFASQASAPVAQAAPSYQEPSMPEAPPIIAGPQVSEIETPHGTAKVATVEGSDDRIVKDPRDGSAHLIGADGQVKRTYTPDEIRHMLAGSDTSPDNGGPVEPQVGVASRVGAGGKDPEDSFKPYDKAWEKAAEDTGPLSEEDILAMAAGADTAEKRNKTLKALKRVEVYGTTLADLLTGSHGAKGALIKQIHDAFPKIPTAKTQKTPEELSRIEAQTELAKSQKKWWDTKPDEFRGKLALEQKKLAEKQANDESRRLNDAIKLDTYQSKLRGDELYRAAKTQIDAGGLAEKIRQFDTLRDKKAGPFRPHVGMTLNIINQGLQQAKFFADQADKVIDSHNKVKDKFKQAEVDNPKLDLPTAPKSTLPPEGSEARMLMPAKAVQTALDNDAKAQEDYLKQAAKVQENNAKHEAAKMAREELEADEKKEDSDIYKAKKLREEAVEQGKKLRDAKKGGK